MPHHRTPVLRRLQSRRDRAGSRSRDFDRGKRAENGRSLATPGAEPRPSVMTPEQWQRVGQLFHEALEMPPGERTTWAGSTCTDDPEVQRELLSLLENERAADLGFVEEKVKSEVV